MLGRVAGAGQRLQPQTAEVDALPAGQAVMGVLQTAGPGCDHPGAERGKLTTARDEVGVQMGLCGHRDAQPTLVRLRPGRRRRGAPGPPPWRSRRPVHR